MPKWSRQHLDAALKEVARLKGKASINAISKKDGIPVSTLHDHVKGKVNKVGAGEPTVLTYAKEEGIVYYCQVLQEIGLGLTKEIASSIIIDYLHAQKRDHPFASGRPRLDWWSRFLKSGQSLKSQHLSTKRASSANPTTISGFFQYIDSLYKKLKLTSYPDMASRIRNCDETCFNTAVGSQFLTKRGSKWVHETGGESGRENITVHMCDSTSGEVLSPCIMYKGKHLYISWTHHGPPGALYGLHQDGWKRTFCRG